MESHELKTILLAEDRDDDVALLQRAFERAHVPSFHIVRDGEEAIGYLKGAGRYSDRRAFPFPNLLLLDLKMPGRSGLEVLEWIRSQQSIRRLPVIALTSSHLPADVNRAYDLGINSYLIKPGDFNALVTRINTLTEYWFAFSRVPAIEPANLSSSKGATAEGRKHG
jgi:CheY-like chemotaxis protein